MPLPAMADQPFLPHLGARDRIACRVAQVGVCGVRQLIAGLYGAHGEELALAPLTPNSSPTRGEGREMLCLILVGHAPVDVTLECDLPAVVLGHEHQQLHEGVPVVERGEA